MKGDRQREAIVEALRGAPGGLDTNELAALLRLHPNTVRWHLGLLEQARLIDASPELRRGRGRPSVAWRLTGEGAAVDREAYDAGVRWGRDLQAAEPGASIIELLDRQGFDAAARGSSIEMRRCPFAALAREAPQVICTLHRGVIDGALAAAGDGHVERLDPFVEPGLCVARLG